MDIGSGLYALIEDGEIVEMPHVMARTDQRFQRFMEAANAPKARRRRKAAA
jgi:hypothetical protein